MQYDLGYFDKGQDRVEPDPNPFAPDNVLTMSPVRTLFELVAMGGIEPSMEIRRRDRLALGFSVLDTRFFSKQIS